MVKPPFSKRQNSEQLEEYYALRNGIPTGLRPTLVNWTLVRYSRDGEVNKARLHQLERLTDRMILDDLSRDDIGELHDAFACDHDLLLDSVDVALRWADDRAIARLRRYLREARSAYCVETDGEDEYEIQYRQPAEMSELVDTEATQPGRAAEHLRTAWSKCFGLNPDPKGACREAVEAIEVAAKPVVTPTDSMPSLGKMCGAIRDKPEKWETVSEFDRSVESVRSMMELVWNEGRYRHGDESAPLEVSQEAAEMTVQTAVLLVSWFRSERIRLSSHVS